MKKPNTGAHPQAKQKQHLSELKERHSRARRRLVQSIAASGAAMSVKSIPDKWARPVLDSTMLPAHAQSTPAHAQAPCTVSCTVSTVEFTADQGSISGFPLAGGQVGSVTRFDLDKTTTFTVSGISAVTGPACTVDLEIDLVNSVETQFTISSGGDLLSLTNNTASFNAVEVEYAGNDPDGIPAAVLDLTFQSPGAGACVIDITFVESPAA